MDETINKVLKALNLLTVQGERNLDLLLFSIHELKHLQAGKTQAMPAGEVK